jgi:hypothetical protein
MQRCKEAKGERKMLTGSNFNAETRRGRGAENERGREAVRKGRSEGETRGSEMNSFISSLLFSSFLFFLCLFAPLR